MTARTDSIVMLTIGGVAGVVFAVTRGFWPAAPLLVIAGIGLVLHLLPPVPEDQPRRRAWANANLVALIVALAATWYESAVLLILGLLLVAVTVAVPWFQRTR